MKNENRPIHPDFHFFLDLKEKALIDLYKDLRNYLLGFYPECNELLYHTHALTSMYSISEKMSNGFCLIPIYTNHMNLGFFKGKLLDDPHKLLKGTGKLMRHIPIHHPDNYRNEKVEKLIRAAIEFEINDMDKPTKITGQTISKIKK